MLDDDVDEFAGGEDDEFFGFLREVGFDFFVCEDGLFDGFFVLGLVGGEGEFGAEFAVDLDDEFYCFGLEGFFVPGGPGVVAAELVEDF